MRFAREGEGADDMMTHNEIVSAFERLRALGANGHMTEDEIVGAAFGIDNNYKIRDRLIDLLEQADPDTHIELPLDADGIPLHVGDEVYARRKNVTYGHYYYFNGIVESIEFEKDKTYAYVKADDDGDEFGTRELHHGGHILTSGQILEDLVDDAFALGVDRAYNKETNSSTTWEARRELVKQYTEQLKPLLADGVE